MTVVDQQDLDIMRHALGWPKRYRNYYVAGPDNLGRLRDMVRRGLMKLSPQSGDPSFGSQIFNVTTDGIACVEGAEILKAMRNV